MSNNTFIPSEKYQEILSCMPIACIDFLVVYEWRFLLWKRSNIPYKGEWFVPGGRILKGETQNSAFARKLFEETGIRNQDIAKYFLLWIYDTQFIGNVFDPAMPTHTINITYAIELAQSVKIIPDVQNEWFQWFSREEIQWCREYIQNLVWDYGRKIVNNYNWQF